MLQSGAIAEYVSSVYIANFVGKAHTNSLVQMVTSCNLVTHFCNMAWHHIVALHVILYVCSCVNGKSVSKCHPPVWSFLLCAAIPQVCIPWARLSFSSLVILLLRSKLPPSFSFASVSSTHLSLSFLLPLTSLTTLYFFQPCSFLGLLLSLGFLQFLLKLQSQTSKFW